MGALVDVVTQTPIPDESGRTVALESTGCIGTDRVSVTVVSQRRALVDVDADDSVALVPIQTGARETAGGVCAVGGIGAIVESEATLIDVLTLTSISGKPVSAGAFETP